MRMCFVICCTERAISVRCHAARRCVALPRSLIARRFASQRRQSDNRRLQQFLCSAEGPFLRPGLRLSQRGARRRSSEERSNPEPRAALCSEHGEDCEHRTLTGASMAQRLSLAGNPKPIPTGSWSVPSPRSALATESGARVRPCWRVASDRLAVSPADPGCAGTGRRYGW